VKHFGKLLKLNKQYDLIGPADKVSNIRKYKFHIPENESKYELEYRLAREKVQNWNHQYWTQQNLKYNFEKQKFINNIKLNENKTNNENNPNEIDPNLMSKFYKKYLDDSFLIQHNYNRQWYRYNFQLLWPAFKVFLYKLLFRNK
jgi:hypothetical protein